MPKGNKYGAKKVLIDGITFDSRIEGRRYESLRRLESMGRIADLQLQPHFKLEGKNGPLINPLTNRRVGTYTADFQYLELGRDGQVLGKVVEEVKGFRTVDYPIRIALLRDNHPDIDFREIKGSSVRNGLDDEDG